MSVAQRANGSWLQARPACTKTDDEPQIHDAVCTGPIYMRFLMIFLAVRMMSNTGNQLNLRDRPRVLSSPFGMPSPFFGP
jgi:hypothetical protein